MNSGLQRALALLLVICMVVSPMTMASAAHAESDRLSPTDRDRTDQLLFQQSNSIASETDSPGENETTTAPPSQNTSVPSSSKFSEDVEGQLEAVLGDAMTRPASTSSSDSGSSVTVTRGNIPNDYPVNVIVRVKKGANFESVRDRVRSLGSLRSTYPTQRLLSAEIPANRFDNLSSVSGVDFVDLNELVGPTSSHTTSNATQGAQSNSHLYQNTDSWGVGRIDADTVHESGRKGSGVVVAVLDTGIARTAGLQDNIAAEEDLEPNSQLDGDDPVDRQGHGSNVAGIIAASPSTVTLPGGGTRRTVGVAPETTLLNAKINSWNDMMHRQGQQAPPDPFGGDITINNLQQSATVTEQVRIPSSRNRNNADGRYLLVEASWANAQDDIQLEFVDRNGDVVTTLSDFDSNRQVQRSSDETSIQLEVNGTGGLDTSRIDGIRVTGQSISGQTDVDIDIQLYNGGFAFFDTMADAVYWASGTTPQGRSGVPQSPGQTADVISLSYGTGDSTNNPVTGAMDVAAENGVVFVTSAGNGGRNVVDESKQKTNIITVGSINRQGQRSGFSQIGDAATDIYKPDIVAPGENIPSAGPPTRIPRIPNQFNGTEKSGTSMATPHVSGVAALYIQTYRDIHGEDPTPQQVRAALMTGAVDAQTEDRSDAQNFQTTTGVGLVNAYNTVVSFSSRSAADSSTDVSYLTTVPEVTPSELGVQKSVLYYQTQSDDIVLTADGTPANQYGPIAIGTTQATPGNQYPVRIQGQSVSGSEQWAFSTLTPMEVQQFDQRLTEGYDVEDPASLDAHESAAYAIGVNTRPPGGQFVGDHGAVRALAYTDGDNDTDIEIYDPTGSVDSRSTISDVGIEQTISTDQTPSQVIFPPSTQPSSISGEWKVVYTENSSSGGVIFSPAVNYPMEPLPSEAEIEPDDMRAGNASRPGSVEFNVKVETANQPYTFQGFGAPDSSHFDVTIGSQRVPSQKINLQRVNNREDKYRLRFVAPKQADSGSYNLTVNFTDEKFNASHTAVATRSGAITYTSGGTATGQTATSIVIDESGSMGGSNIQNAKQAGIDYIAAVGDSDYIGVARFDSRASEAHPMVLVSGNQSSLEGKINGLNAGGTTNIGGGLDVGFRLLDDASGNVSKAAILLSDGQHNTGQNPRQVAQKYQNADIPVYTIALGGGADEALLRDIGNDTGGEFYRTSDPGNLQAIYNDIRTTVSQASTFHTASGSVSSNNQTSDSFGIGGGVDSANLRVQLGTGGSSSSEADAAGAQQQASPPQVKLQYPNGTTVPYNLTGGVSVDDPAITYTDIGGTVIYQLEDPQTGEWSYEIVNSGGSQLQYDTQVTGSAVATLGVSTDSNRYLNGSTATISASLVNDSGGVSGATVTATITLPDGNTTTVQLRKQVGGTYVADFPVTQTGTYQASVNARYRSLSREQQVSWTVVSQSAILSINTTDQPPSGAQGETLSTAVNISRPSPTTASATNADSGSEAPGASDFDGAVAELVASSPGTYNNSTVDPEVRAAADIVRNESSNASAVIDSSAQPTAAGPSGTANVYLSLGNLSGPNGSTITQSQISISASVVRLSPGDDQTVQVRVRVPPGADPGVYTGQLKAYISGTAVPKEVRVNVTKATASTYQTRIQQAAQQWATSGPTGKQFYEERIADSLTQIYFGNTSVGGASTGTADRRTSENQLVTNRPVRASPSSTAHPRTWRAV